MKTKLLFKPVQRLFTLLLILMLFSSVKLFAQGAGTTLLFSGGDEMVTIPSDSGGILNPGESITLEAWINLKVPASDTHRPHFVSKTGIYALVIETDGRPSVYIHNDSVWANATGTTPLVSNKWYHVAGTYDGDSIRIYLNGKLANKPVHQSHPMGKNHSELKLGNRLGGIESLKGELDEVKIWNTSRTEKNIQKTMNLRLTGNETGLIGYWRLDDTAGKKAIDSSPNENNGTLTNMDTTTVWNISRVPLGNYSLYAISDDITHNTDCTVDVIFDTVNGPGNSYSLAAVQINDKPNDSTGLTNVPDQYWQLWSENSLFDSTFSATINFHYDNIFGIQDESQLELYRRQNATSPKWEKVNGFTIESGSSTTDGKGYIRWAISQDTVGGFSGQYILSGSNPLKINKIVNNIDLSLYPNPNNGSFNIELALEKIQDIEIQVLSLNGQIIWSKKYRNQSGNMRYPVNLEGQPKGIYILNVKTKSGQINKRIIIQ